MKEILKQSYQVSVTVRYVKEKKKELKSHFVHMVGGLEK